jgi:hypothetical protein
VTWKMIFCVLVVPLLMASVAQAQVPGGPVKAGGASGGGSDPDDTYLRLDASNDPLTGSLLVEGSALSVEVENTSAATAFGLNLLTPNADAYLQLLYRGQLFPAFVLQQPAQGNINVTGAGGLLINTVSGAGEGWGGPVVMAAGINTGQERARFSQTASRLSMGPAGALSETLTLTTASLEYIDSGTPVFTASATAFGAGVPYWATAASAGTPSYSWDADPNTGFFRRGEDQIGISTGGTGRYFFGLTGLFPTTSEAYQLGDTGAQWLGIYTRTVTADTELDISIAGTTQLDVTADGVDGRLTTSSAAPLVPSFRLFGQSSTAVPTKPTCDGPNVGRLIYVDDTDDGNDADVCVCARNSASSFTYRSLLFDSAGTPTACKL